MKRRAFLTLAVAPALLAFVPRAHAAAPLLFHDHGHGLAFSPDGSALLAPSHEGPAAYEDGVWWEAPGPDQGFSGFAVAEHALYASGHSLSRGPPGSAAGLLRSIDGGRTWRALALAGEADFHLLAAGYRSGAIYVLNSQPNRVMATAALFLTRDEGQTWQQVPARGLSGEIHALAAHPANAAVVAAGSDTGLYVSHDAGARFRRLQRRGPVTALAFEHAGRRLLYAAALSNDLYDQPLEGSGRHTLRLPPLSGDYVTCLAHSPTDERTLAFATRRRDVYLTRDAGRTWRRIASRGEARRADAEQR